MTFKLCKPVNTPALLFFFINVNQTAIHLLIKIYTQKNPHCTYIFNTFEYNLIKAACEQLLSLQLLAISCPPCFLAVFLPVNKKHKNKYMLVSLCSQLCV